MRKFFAVLNMTIIILFTNILSAQIDLKPRTRSGEITHNSDSYLYISEKTADYIIKAGSQKMTGFAFLLKNNSGEWIRKNLDLITKGKIIVFVNAALDKQERKYLDELAKLSDYSMKIVCFSGNCEKNDGWKYPLIRGLYYLKWIKDKKDELVLYGIGKKSVGKLSSVVDLKSFKDSPIVEGSIFFNEHSIGFVSIDENDYPDFANKSDILIYYSKSEKKIKEFIEKKK